MQQFEEVVKLSVIQRGRKRNMKRNSLTAEILKQFGDCEVEGINKAKNSKKQKHKSPRGNLLKIFKRDIEPEVQTFQTQALEITKPGPEFDPNATPQDGMEYLMKMSYERERCPVIVQCPLPDSTDSSYNVQTTQTDAMITSFEMQIDESEKLGKNIFLTTPEWIHAQTCTFLKTRSTITLLRMNLSSNTIQLPIASYPLPTEANEETEWRKFCVQNEPLLSVILHFGQRQIELLLEYLSKWLKELSCAETVDEVEAKESAKKDCDLLGDERWLGVWIYATLICLELPLEPQVHSTLREIARSYILLRSHLEFKDEQRAAQYNVFVAIIVGVFEQYDFKEYLQYIHL